RRPVPASTQSSERTVLARLVRAETRGPGEGVELQLAERLPLREERQRIYAARSEGIPHLVPFRVHAPSRALGELPFPFQSPPLDPVLVRIVAEAEKGAQRERGFRQGVLEQLPGAHVLLERQGFGVGVGGFGVALGALSRPPELEPG